MSNTNVQLTWHPQGMEQTTNQATIGPVTTPTAAGYEVLRRLNVLEVFNGTKFLNITLPPPPPSTGSTTGSGGGTGGVAGPPQVSATLSATQINLVNQSYAALQESVYSALVVQTRLRSYLGSVRLVVDDTGVHFNAAPMAAALDARKTSDARNGLIDLVDLNRYAQPALQAVGFAGVATLRSWVDALPATSPLRSELPALGVMLASATGGTDTADVYLGDALANTFSGGGGNDMIDGGAGNDNLQGGAGDDVIDGGAGNDILAGDYVNTFQGWYGGAGNDTYLFGRGDGQDMAYDLDTTTNNLDRIIFKAGVAPTDVQVVRLNDDLVLKIAGTTDQIQVNNYFAGDGAAGWAIEQINFTDSPATTWTVADVKNLSLTGGAGNDTLIGFAGDDVIAGNAGNDTLSGRAGNDNINGGDGDDLIYGEAGNDTLLGGLGNDNLQGGIGDDTIDGGVGNDVLAGDFVNTFQGWYGGAGNDTYLFGRGDGQDMVYDLDTTANNLDKIVFKAGVAPSDVQVVRVNDDLVLKIAGTTDQIQVSNYFAGDGSAGWTIEEIRFTDAPATAWTVADVKAKAIVGGAGNDTLTGYASDDAILGNGGNDTLSGRAGNDSINGGDGDDLIYGEAGNDTLIGGLGNDNLQGGIGDDTLDGGAGNDILSGDFVNTFQGWYGGAGNDTYLFGRGDGQDTVYDYDTTANNLDKLVFKTGVAPNDVQVVRSGDNLVLKITGTTDQIQVSNYFANDGGSGWTVEEIRFTDSPTTAWTVTDVKAKALVGGTGNDTLTGYAGDDVIVGDAGNDTLSGQAGNDSLDGGAGDDLIYGDAGNDTLLGGAGNDNLQGGIGDDTMDGGAGNDILSGDFVNTFQGWYGGAGNDTYLFGRGDGQDTVYDYDTTASNLDKLVFKAGVAPSDVQVVRSGDNLVLKITGTTDQIQLSNYFATNGTAGWLIEEIRFASSPATVLKYADVTNALAQGGSIQAGVTTTGGGILQGTAYADALTANAYGTQLNGGAGNDLLVAQVNGSIFDVVFNGGTGDDTMTGSYARDIYKFNLGDGNDTITDDVRSNGQGVADYFAANPTADTYQDRIEFGAGITAAGVTRSRSGNDMVLTLNSADSITVKNWFDGTVFNKIEKVVFANGTQWSIADMEQGLVAAVGVILTGGGTLQGTQYADTLTANAYGAQLNGGGGNDQLLATVDGGVFDVVFNGGTGDDTITGSYARDVYKFNLGDGHDIITDDVRRNGQGVADYFAANPTADTYQDRIEFGAGITASSITRSRSGNDMVLTLNGADSVTVKNWFDGTVFDKIEKVVFADGTQWAIADIELGLVPPPAGVTLTGGGTLAGTAYADTLTANAYGTVMNGGAGNDQLVAQVGGSIFDLTFNGGAGDDRMTGSYARDIYKFNLGDGHDTITDDVRANGQGVADYFAANPTADTYQDRIEFGAGITAQGVSRSRVGNDMVLTLNSADGITVKNWFDGTVFNKIETVLFADGTAWTAADVENGQTLTGGGTLNGTQYADTLTANAYGTQLNGGAGNDQLLAQVGGSIFNVTFNGGVGNDTMTGSYGGDVYKFNLGDGRDTINDDVRANGQGPADYFAATPADPGYQDRIEFGAGITAQSVSRSRAGNDMVFSLNGGADSITVKNWFDGTIFNKIEKVLFADGTQWTAAQVEQGAGTAGADNLVGTSGADLLEGLAGDDVLAGKLGDDRLIGGAGSDTYRFTRGDGHDTVVENDAAAATDVAIFDGGVASGQLWFQRIGDNLEVKVIGTTDAMTISDWYLGASHQVEQFKVDGNKTLLASDLQNLVQAMASFAPPAAGQTTLPQNYQDSLNGVIAANWH